MAVTGAHQSIEKDRQAGKGGPRQAELLGEDARHEGVLKGQRGNGLGGRLADEGLVEGQCGLAGKQVHGGVEGGVVRVGVVPRVDGPLARAEHRQVGPVEAVRPVGREGEQPGEKGPHPDEAVSVELEGELRPGAVQGRPAQHRQRLQRQVVVGVLEVELQKVLVQGGFQLKVALQSGVSKGKKKKKKKRFD